MESIEEIHKLIAELSFAIDVQLDVLRALEKRRSDARRALNSRLDPMARLPVEIASEIFIRCTPDSPSPVFMEEPLKLLHICQLWREIAVSCPSLWTSIQIEPVRPPDPDLHKASWAWFERARALPLSLSLHGSMAESAGAWLTHFAGKIANLKLHIVDDSELSVIEEKGPFPALQTMKICSASVDDSENENSYGFLFISSTLPILSAAPSLVECTFESVQYLYPDDHSEPRMTHTSLQHLRLGIPSPGPFSFNSAGILLGLRLPALETLHLTDLDISPEDLISFFADSGSASSLQALHMDISPVERSEWRLSTNLLNSCFRPLTALRTLELFNGPERDYIALLRVMRAQDFLPNLQRLLIHGHFDKPSNWKLLLDTIVARGLRGRRSLCSVKVISVTVPTKTDLPLDVLEALRELVKVEGMSIYVGTISRNFV
ncbi:hypothetical protein R3P38DRAFT_2733356 [Favolaschia claudopus]|uniref:F-box domain-containing protein n=1 Tax=Favolaschia claudopus TaxID=2862362 RepID=A0AAW0A2S4_9AGAR